MAKRSAHIRLSLYTLLFSLVAGIIFPLTAGATVVPGQNVPDQPYFLLAPLPNDGSSPTTFVDAANPIGYIKTLMVVLISLAVVVAVFMIVYGGFMYMTTDAYTNKTEGKTIIKRTLWGLLLLIGSALILTTINSNLTDLTALKNLTTPPKVTKVDPNGAIWCTDVKVGTVAYTTDCVRATESVCTQHVTAWNSQKASLAPRPCQKTNEPAIFMRKWYTDVYTDKSQFFYHDDTAGLAFDENNDNYYTCTQKVKFYKSNGVIVLEPSCYVDPFSYSYCIDTLQNGKKGVDCSAGVAYKDNFTNLNTCEQKIKYWSNPSDHGVTYSASACVKQP
jgi:hypothetical protein